jgi:hypothetical protein
MFDIRAKIFSPVLQLFTLIIFSATATAQTSKEVKDMFVQAEYHYLYGEYELANPIYLTIASFLPDNNNINYKIGNCYLNITDEKTKAIGFLEKAVINSSLDAKANKLSEKRAPLDVYFSLARAYMINNELDKAISTLEVFQRLIKDSGSKKATMENTGFIDQQILACKNAIGFIEKPVAINKMKLPDEFSQGSINDNPAVSYDGNTIAYTERRGISNAIFFSKKEKGKWQPPIEITNELNAGEDCSTCSLNSDGTELYLYKEDIEDGNIYSSTFADGRWNPIRKLNSNINTKYFESHAAISADGKKLYFTSNRERDGMDLDIFVSERDASGEWGPAKNLGNSVNTQYNEDTPFITRDDTVLFFSSEGHNSMGGFDVFRVSKKGGNWGQPSNLGYPINSTDDDKFYEPFNDGLNAYYTLPTSYKKRDIYYIGLGIPAVDIFFDITGTVSLNDSLQKPDESFKIFLLNSETGDTIKTGFPVKDTGLYRFTVNPGKYSLIYTGINYISQTIDTVLAKDFPSKAVTLNVLLQKEPEPVTYEKIDLASIPTVTDIDTATLVTDVKVVSDDVSDSDVLYYTVQVMALYNPVDISYFKHINNMKVMYNDVDKFYRYTTGQFTTREEAVARRAELIAKGYPEDIFVKKVSK